MGPQPRSPHADTHERAGYRRLSISALGQDAAWGLITFKDAFPGKAKTFVVWESHTGVALIVSQRGGAWVKDTLATVDVHQTNEMGLLGIAFHPDYRNNHKYYLSYDPLNGDLCLGDVGQEHIEEADIVALGGNYGWKDMEGHSGTNSGKMSLPVFTYDHAIGTCIIGGVVFRGDTASKC